MDVVNVENLVRDSKVKELSNVIATMEQIEVHGSQNLNMLLGCIQHLNALLNEMKEEEQ